MELRGIFFGSKCLSEKGCGTPAFLLMETGPMLYSFGEGSTVVPEAGDNFVANMVRGGCGIKAVVMSNRPI